MYSTELKVCSIPAGEFLDKYCFPDKYMDACRACPDYGRVWSCPPGVPPAADYLAGCKTAYVVGVKVIYDEKEREIARSSPEELERIRAATYGEVKKEVLDALLRLEPFFPNARILAAGRCEQCDACTRPEGLPCRKPGRMRYSFSAFGFDLTALAGEILQMELLWAAQGLPEYNVALAALVTG